MDCYWRLTYGWSSLITDRYLWLAVHLNIRSKSSIYTKGKTVTWITKMFYKHIAQTDNRVLKVDSPRDKHCLEINLAEVTFDPGADLGFWVGEGFILHKMFHCGWIDLELSSGRVTMIASVVTEYLAAPFGGHQVSARSSMMASMFNSWCHNGCELTKVRSFFSSSVIMMPRQVLTCLRPLIDLSISHNVTQVKYRIPTWASKCFEKISYQSAYLSVFAAVTGRSCEGISFHFMSHMY